jgi:ABC-type multidrug transport system ATPase subunit
LSIRGTGKKHDVVHHNRLIKNYALAENAIVVKRLIKWFKLLKVLDGIDFVVKHGTVLALLGPNRAGKTTTVHILSTLLLPDGGKA